MSTIISANVSDGTLSIPTTFVTNGSAKAFLKVDQRSTQAILSSFNVSSITDAATGATTVAFTNAMADANYAPTGGTDFDADAYSQFQFRFTLTTSLRIENSPDFNVSTDDGVVSCAILGDLA
jgi:hypothetical protein